MAAIKLTYTEPKDQDEVKPGEIHTISKSVKIDDSDSKQVAATVDKFHRSGYDVDVKITPKESK